MSTYELTAYMPPWNYDPATRDETHIIRESQNDDLERMETRARALASQGYDVNIQRTGPGISGPILIIENSEEQQINNSDIMANYD